MEFIIPNLDVFLIAGSIEDDFEMRNESESGDGLNLIQVQQKKTISKESSDFPAKKIRFEKVSILKDLLELKRAIPQFSLYLHDPSEWVSTVKMAVAQYEQPNEIMTYLHSFFKQKAMVTWYLTVKLTATDLEVFRGLLEKKVHTELVKAHKLADLHLDEYLKEIKYTGEKKLEEFLKTKLLLFADLYPFFPKEKVHEKIFYQMGEQKAILFMPFRKDTLDVILHAAQMYENF